MSTIDSFAKKPPSSSKKVLAKSVYFSQKKKAKSAFKEVLCKKKKALADTDRGSWFQQEEQWPDIFPAQQLSTGLNSVLASASERKIYESQRTLLETEKN